MQLDIPQIVDYEIGLEYTGWGMPMTAEVILDKHQLYYGPVTSNQLFAGKLTLESTTPFRLQVSLKDKTYAHTDLVAGHDHLIRVNHIRFCGYDLMPLMHLSEYHAYLDCNNQTPEKLTIIKGSGTMGHNGTWVLGTFLEPFFTWYHKNTHQGTLYSLT